MGETAATAGRRRETVMPLDTIQRLFWHNDWANGKLLDAAGRLADDALDRAFPIGPGSIRKTLYHIFIAEWLWLRRWGGVSPRKGEEPREFVRLDELAVEWRSLVAQRRGYLTGLSATDLPRAVTYSNLRGDTHTFALGHLLIHVATHGVHHRAQVVNMLRQVGATPPELDFLGYAMEAGPLF